MSKFNEDCVCCRGGCRCIALTVSRCDEFKNGCPFYLNLEQRKEKDLKSITRLIKKGIFEKYRKEYDISEFTRD